MDLTKLFSQCRKPSLENGKLFKVKEAPLKMCLLNIPRKLVCEKKKPFYPKMEVIASLLAMFIESYSRGCNNSVRLYITLSTNSGTVLDCVDMWLKDFNSWNSISCTWKCLLFGGMKMAKFKGPAVWVSALVLFIPV